MPCSLCSGQNALQVQHSTAWLDETVTELHRFGTLDNAIPAPHSTAWTVGLFRNIGRQSMLDLSQGRRPTGVLNPEPLEIAGFRTRWSRIIGIEKESL